MCVLSIKHDEQGRPVHAKSRIVVLGNMEAQSWEKGEADCRNAFCHRLLPKDEVFIVHPPA
eukprot:4030877-Ditylum_brightwellii.AAC.1